MPKGEYTVVNDSSLCDMERSVMRLMGEGFWLVGGIMMEPSIAGSKMHYYQAMCKYTQEAGLIGGSTATVEGNPVMLLSKTIK